MDERRDEADFLLHAMRIGGDGIVQPVRDLECLGEACHPFPSLGLRHLINVCDEMDVLRAGEVIVDVGIVRYVGEFALASDRVAPDGLAIDQDVAILKIEHTHGTADGRGFPRAIVTDEAVYLTGFHLQAQAVYRQRLARIGFRKISEFQHVSNLLSRRVQCRLNYMPPS